MLVRGNELSEKTKAEVLRSYIYRRTTENGYPKINPTGATIPAVSDVQWLAEHAFYVRKDGVLDRRYSNCEPAIKRRLYCETGKHFPEITVTYLPDTGEGIQANGSGVCNDYYADGAFGVTPKETEIVNEQDSFHCYHVDCPGYMEECIWKDEGQNDGR